ncbi:hypothetical protein CCHL11_07541 [Colletotrichum chlorophyti]|uniref:Uncharacterized protein n=1 Tax=Colletotrichum chlorophyti TaxID=708187 RepID=A0A1Q8RZS4_9PEZI|nr:hypothetical protein CCHL11_07541 [Colletotrichum chlorophyti]
MADAQLTIGRTDDYVLISKPKKAIAYVEARFKDGVAILARLERELSPPKLNDNFVFFLESDLLEEPAFNKDVPAGIFHSLRVVEFQGLDPSIRFVSAGDVAIKVNLYGFTTDESPSVFDDEMVTVLPAPKLDGLWEL